MRVLNLNPVTGMTGRARRSLHPRGCGTTASLIRPIRGVCSAWPSLPRSTRRRGPPRSAFFACEASESPHVQEALLLTYEDV